MGPIGIFDSGFGGLTVFKEIKNLMPQYDTIYLGDNARVPYGNRSFETVYMYTKQCIEYLFEQGCPLVIVACNTASAKALRNIQQIDLPQKYPNHRVLGVIRPTTEAIGRYTKTRNIGILATQGTVASQSYVIEINKFYPDINVYQQACPMWVPLVENGEHNGLGADFFVQKYINELHNKSQKIDTIVLACTHYPLLINTIKKFILPDVHIVSQGALVADRLADYLDRHPDIQKHLSTNHSHQFLTTDDARSFEEKSVIFLDTPIAAKKISLQ